MDLGEMRTCVEVWGSLMAFQVSRIIPTRSSGACKLHAADVSERTSPGAGWGSTG